MCFPANFPKLAGAIFLQAICQWPPLNVLYFVVSQKGTHLNQKETHVHLSTEVLFKKLLHYLRFLKISSTKFR